MIELCVAILLFAGAYLGHIAIWVYHHNWWYAYPFRKHWASDVVHLFHAVVLLAFPVALFLVFGFKIELPIFDSSNPWGSAFAWYVSVCRIVGLGFFPALVLWRHFRSTPAVLLSNHTQNRDLAAELGCRPVGRSKFQKFARLPLNEIFQVDFSEKVLRLPNLPEEWDGLTILHLSDLHFIGAPDRIFFERVMEICAERPPDLIALSGDIVDSHQHRRWIIPVLGKLKWKNAALAILGNHDVRWEPELVRRRLRKIRMNVLGNGWQQIEVRGRPMIVVGHEGPWFQPEPDLSECPEGIFRLLLSHTPDNIAWARQHRIDLMLSGHNHGGQVRLPLIGSVFVPSRYGRKYDCGLFHEASTVLHVSRGIGAEHPIRYNCRPEVVTIVLRKDDRGDTQPQTT